MQCTTPEFRYFDKQAARQYLRPRAGEAKLGEHIRFPEAEAPLPSDPPPFVLIGAPEDVGIRANLGLAGAAGGWEAFLAAFLNLQENRFFSGKQFMVLGALQLPDSWAADRPGAQPEQLRNRTVEIDRVLSPIIKTVFDAGSLPIVIGGGHNNAYPILEAGWQSFQHSLNVINIDPHSDYRAMEGRHSGNGFRYARQHGFLKKYALLGLHEGYNAEAILNEISHDPDFLPIFWEEIFLKKCLGPEDALERCLEHVGLQYFGLELDLDSIENALSSAATPVGLSPSLCMNWLYNAGKHPKAIYLHLPEAAVVREDGLQAPLTGKLLSYLVQAFCKGVQAR